MKVVLVNPPSPPEFRVSRGLMGGFGMAVNPALLYPPIELAHVAAYLEQDGFQVAIIDGDALRADEHQTLARIVGEAVRQSNANVMPTIGRYQREVAGGDYRL